MAACHALTRDGHPCRGYGVETTAANGATGFLCHMHTDYFRGFRPDEHIARLAYPYMTDDETRWVTTMLRSPLYHADSARIMECLKPLLHRASENDSRRASFLYELYLKAGVLRPLASLPLWRRCMRSALRVLGYSCKPSYEDGSVEIPSHFQGLAYSYFGHLCKGLPPSVVLPYFLEMMREHLDTMAVTFRHPAGRARASAEIWKAILRCLLCSTANRQLIGYSAEVILRAVDARNEGFPSSTWHVEGVRDCLAGLLKAEQQRQREAARQRFDAMKEEIMMVAWHPTRVMRLLEAGLEIEDM